MDRAVMRAPRCVFLAGALLALAPGVFAQALVDPTRPPDAAPVPASAASAGAARPQLALDIIQDALQAAHCQLQSVRRAPPG